MYFSEEQISLSFKRLASRKQADGNKTKTHLERTSVLMCFLAFDARCKSLRTNRLDMNPDRPEGKANRDGIALEFSKLVLLDNSPQKLLQVLELGKVSGGGKNPADRLSSNFLTVPLKKATEQQGDFFYPKRPPSSPMIKLGLTATGLKWGMEYHSDWPTSFPKLLSEIKESTPFTDLAIFIMRDTSLNGKDYIEALSESLYARFSEKLATFWNEKIKKEKMLAKHILINPFSSTHQAFAKSTQFTSINCFDGITRDKLLEHVLHLESLLKVNQIEFESLKERLN